MSAQGTNIRCKIRCRFSAWAVAIDVSDWWSLAVGENDACRDDCAWAVVMILSSTKLSSWAEEGEW